MGVGGGFLTFPMFVYGLGVSTFTTVGTDILQIIFTTSYSSIFQYAIYGFVFYTVSVGMLLGSLIGVQVGALVTTIVRGSQIRVFYALTILAGFANRACALPRKLADMGYLSLSRETSVWIERVGTVLFFAIVGIFAAWILWVFLRQLSRLRTVDPDRPGCWIVHPRPFWLGVAGLVVVFLVLGVSAAPVYEGRSSLMWADRFFNRLAKDSANSLAKARALAGTCAPLQIDMGVHPRDLADPEKLIGLLARAGIPSRATGDGRVRVQAPFADILAAATADAALAFANRFDDLREKYGFSGEDAIYAWWLIFDGLTRRFVQEGLSAQTEMAKFMSTKVLEPAYNFRGIQARPIHENALPVVGLLTFYVIYTLWYGFAILSLFEGLGISAGGAHERREH